MELDFSEQKLKKWVDNFFTKVKRFRFGAKAQLAFLEDFYMLINDGIPANRAIEMMSQVTTGISREVAISIGYKISQGRQLAEGMRDWFSLGVVEIIRVGEEGGALSETVKSAINTLQQSTGIMGILLNAMAYPLLVILMSCTIILYLDGSVFLQFRDIKPIEEWPEAGLRMVAIASFLRTWWWLVILGVTALIVVLRTVMSNYTGEFRVTLDKVPPFSLYRRFASARLMETMGLLVANGVVFKNAIKVMQFRANPYLSYHLMMMEHILGMGQGNIADVLNTGLIAQDDILRLRVMAEVKGFEHGLIRMGIRGSEETTKTMKTIARTVGGILLVIGAGLIIIIVQGIYLTGMAMGS